MNNVDKHRVVVAAVTANARTVLRPNLEAGNVVDGRRSIFIPETQLSASRVVRNGFKIGHVRAASPDQVLIDLQVRLGLRFGSTCPEIARLPLIPTLIEIRDTVQSVVEGFASDFE